MQRIFVLLFSLAFSLVFIGQSIESSEPILGVNLAILGTIQDAGSPQLACRKACCRNLFLRPATDRRVASLGLIDEVNERTYLIEATPDFVDQARHLASLTSWNRPSEIPDGIFLTHAHIGHYTGLMYLGREALGAVGAPVYAMPRMSEFLNTNGPWDLLVEAGHIALRPLVAGTSVVLSSELSVTPFLVPHRDEYSETVGYRIEGPSLTVLFIPDIDKWSRWETSLQEAVAGCDLALIDGTFYDGAEVGHRDLSLIPHPFVIESLEIMEDWPRDEREKVQFIHLNHTNPLLAPQSEAADSLRATGASIARFGAIFAL